jgi:asparagine synthase (glutamine-hydrolysing)
VCGILGFTGPHRPELAARGLELLGHRGPDERGVHAAEGVTLAAARLAIVGLGRGRQPLANEAGDVVAVVNGELYDHAEVRAGLERRGHRFSTASDAEIVVHLYEEEGDRFVDRLAGIFALALWDARRARLLLVRDPFGVKPLFWTEWAGSLRFGSEIKALLADPELPRELDPLALDCHLALGFVLGGGTLLAGVHELPPGHLLVHERGTTAIRPYRRPAVEPGPLAEEPVHGFLGRFERAVESQLAREVPMAFALSGGIDSSLVVAVARRLTGAPIRTFAVGSA